MLSTELIILNYPVISRLNLLSVLEDAKHKKEGKNSQTANNNRSHDPTGQTTWWLLAHGSFHRNNTRHHLFLLVVLGKLDVVVFESSVRVNGVDVKSFWITFTFALQGWQSHLHDERKKKTVTYRSVKMKQIFRLIVNPPSGCYSFLCTLVTRIWC